MPDPFDLQRFVRAQDPVLEQVRAELAAGRKRTHWMWFVFPQLEGLGHSAMARHYALPSLAAARAYLAHDVLGERLRELTGLAIAARASSALALFGSPDDMKFRSCMTLFAHADPAAAVFRAALEAYFGGGEDARTVERLGAAA